ncbi:T9SS type A sorting domain-containing protein [Planktosalinus lacus]|uniref:Secretion system C-terminal sorting domain-containing protein n=1 Tax=Planktosalinus lacus TaxID=1526573 RepID=A0A8J2V8P3_9FLAO|nr:Omp28-related outer membrane protein [Planktosalinus lacus]GGD87665.1 hypothetical protein GCM10011312_09600 [Planktosalinus lacus]
MFKKLLTGTALLMIAFPLFSQTIVSTDPENKKVILEEFTGINCVYCPDGHAIAQAIKNNNPDEVFLVNIHVGGYATPGAGQPDFRTPFGTAINNQAGVLGYPAGTVNRHVFPGWSQNGANGTAMSRNFWTAASNQILDQPSYVNMGVEASIDVNTRELTVHVEAYYTDDSPVGTNKLNVALLQNNTLGPQTGGGMGNEYVHMHRLVHMVTGQWGVDVNTTTEGSFVDETFTYTIPNDYNGVPVDFFEAEMEVVVFMTETQQEVISGNGAYATYTGLANNNDAAIQSVVEIDDQCSGVLAPTLKVQNLGLDPLTSLDIEYSVNGGTPEVYTWSGNLTSLLIDEIELPEISYDILANNELVITLSEDDDNSNNEYSANFDQAIESGYELDLTIQTDGWGTEVRWNIKNADGTTIAQGGPYGNNQTINVPTITVTDDCYTFNLIDTFGDGGGPVSLVDSDGLVIYSTSGNYGSGESTNFSTTGNPLSINDNDINQVVLYPNPSYGIVNVQTNSPVSISVFDITGKLVNSIEEVNNGENIDLSTLQAGMYLVKINDGINQQTQKLIIK